MINLPYKRGNFGMKTGIVTKSIAFSILLLFVGATVGISNSSDATPSDSIHTQDAVYAQGSGTLDNPYMIEDVYQLQDMNLNLGAQYALANDIDASETSSWNNGLGFDPIGSSSTNQFYGSLNGQNHTITGLYINRPDALLVGLFGFVGDSGMISNVGLLDANVSSGKYQSIGTLVALNRGLVLNCFSSGKVYGGYRVGGLVGENNPGTVKNCHASVTVTAFENRIGGLVGFNWNGFVYNSYASGNVQGMTYVGGLVGRNYNGVILDSYASGDVTGGSSVGGLAGNSEDGIIASCYALGLVTGDWAVGGLLGYSWSASLNNSYATGTVNANSDVGGLVGYVFISSVDKSYSIGAVSGNENVGGLIGVCATGGAVSNSFWDQETSGVQTSAAGTGKTTDEMHSIETFNDITTVGLDEPWDICDINEHEDETWYIDDGNDYPRLGWQKTDSNLPPIFGRPTPENGSTANPLDLTWSIPIDDPDGDLFSWKIQCSNGQSNSGTSEMNGTKSLILTNLAPSTTYQVWVNATDPDGSGLYSRAWYTFITYSPSLEIINVTGGFTLKAALKNTGDAVINDIRWNIRLAGGLILIGKQTTGSIAALESGAEQTFTSKPILGLGKTIVTITAQAVNAGAETKTVKGTVLLFFVILQ